MFVHTHIVGVFHHVNILLSLFVWVFSLGCIRKILSEILKKDLKRVSISKGNFSISDSHDNIIEPILLLCHFLPFVFLFLVKCSTLLQVFLSILLL